MKENINPRFLVLMIFIWVVAAMRIWQSAEIGYWSNFSPIGAMCLFGGSYFASRWKSFVFPLLTIFISDVVIQVFLHKGQYGLFYSGWYWIYIAFVLITLMGKWLIKKVNTKHIVLAAVLASLTHWLIADGMTWLYGGIDLRTNLPLTRDWDGIIQCYTQGLPFMRNFLFGTLVYSGLMFGGFEWVKKHHPSLSLAN